jgi:hypothetical protein
MKFHIGSFPPLISQQTFFENNNVKHDKWWRLKIDVFARSVGPLTILPCSLVQAEVQLCSSIGGVEDEGLITGRFYSNYVRG